MSSERIRRRAGIGVVGAALIAGSGCSPLVGIFWDAMWMGPFDSFEVPPAPDYDDDSGWAALPTRDDVADALVDGETDGQALAEVDVFYVHPTTYWTPPVAWNGDPEDGGLAAVTDDEIRDQASIFNSAGRVFAPKYRQTTGYAQMKGDADGLQQSFAISYGDVDRAFEQFMAERNQGRPIVLAGHSQGSLHLLRVLEDRFTGQPLRERLVAAYLVGLMSPADQREQVIPDIPACGSATDAGCVISWNSLGPDGNPGDFEQQQVYYPDGFQPATGKVPTFLCTNPLTWSSLAADAASNLGGALFPNGGGETSYDSGLAGASCEDGVLRVDTPDDQRYKELLLGPGVYHLYDYALFYANTRRNAEERVAAFLAAN